MRDVERENERERGAVGKAEVAVSVNEKESTGKYEIDSKTEQILKGKCHGPESVDLVFFCLY